MRRREYILTLTLLAATLALTFFPMLFEGRTVLPSDMIDTMTLPFSQHYGPEHAYNSLITDGYLQFYPLKYFTKQAYEHGNFAFWNPYILNGYPQYLEGMWTYNFVLFLPFAIAFPLILLLPLLVAGMGMYSLLREYEVRPGIARIFATAYMLNALFMTHLLAHFIPASFSFAPWVLLFLHKYWRTPHFKYLAGSAIALALGFMAGNLQTIGFLIFLTICYWVALWSLDSHHSFLALLKPPALVLGFAIGLSMVMLLPTAEFFKEVLSHGQLYSTSLGRSYSILSRLLSIVLSFTFFIPQLAGSIRGIMLDQVVGVYTIDFEGAIGFLPLLLALWSSITLWKRIPSIRPFALLMLLGFLLPVATPFFHLVYHRFFIIFILGTCGAGALGFESLLLKPELRHSMRKWTTVSAILVLCAVALVGVSTLIFHNIRIRQTVYQQLFSRLSTASFAQGNPAWVETRLKGTLNYWKIFNPELLFGIVTSLLGLTTLTYCLRTSERTKPTLLAVIWILTTLQLAYFARAWFPIVDTHRYPLYPKTPEIATIQNQFKNGSTYVWREVIPDRQYMLINNENIVYDIREVTGFESVVPRSLYVILGQWSTPKGINSEFLGKFNVGTLISEYPLSSSALISIGVSGSILIYHNMMVRPRAFLTNSSMILPNDTSILKQLLDTLGQWPTAYFTPDQHPIILSKNRNAQDSISGCEYHGNDILVHVQTVDSTYLILTDTYYPGWEATVDGNVTPVLRCNYAMRAVLIPPGQHKVEMIFAPASFRIGRWISIATIFLLALFGIRDTRRFRKIEKRGTNDHVTHFSANSKTIGQ